MGQLTVHRGGAGLPTTPANIYVAANGNDSNDGLSSSTPKLTFPLREQWKYVRGTKFQGVGIYPDWYYHGVKRGGFHLDLRIDAQIWRPDGKGGKE